MTISQSASHSSHSKPTSIISSQQSHQDTQSSSVKETPRHKSSTHSLSSALSKKRDNTAANNKYPAKHSIPVSSVSIDTDSDEQVEYQDEDGTGNSSKKPVSEPPKHKEKIYVEKMTEG